MFCPDKIVEDFEKHTLTHPYILLYIILKYLVPDYGEEYGHEEYNLGGFLFFTKGNKTIGMMTFFDGDSIHIERRD